MTTLTATDPRVVNFYNHYHTTVIKRPSLYTAGLKSIVVTLPSELLDYANAAAGHSGFGAGARPVGIRRTVDNSGKVISAIFQSPDSLAKFINSSECNAAEYIETVRLRHASKSSTTDDRPANEVFFEKYTTNDAKALQLKFGKEMVIREFQILTINEFELRYGL